MKIFPVIVFAVVLFASCKKSTNNTTPAATVTPTPSPYTDIFNFNGTNGRNPLGAVILSGNKLYGTASGGGSGDGIIFCVNTDGSGFTDMFDFNGTNGLGPVADLTLSGSTLYGITLWGGVNGDGNIFSIGTTGGGFKILFNFGPSDTGGGSPSGDLIIAGNRIYCATGNGGIYGAGNIFSITIGGNGYRDLHDFSDTVLPPNGGLVICGSKLFGVTVNQLYSLDTNGNSYKNLIRFTGTNGSNAEGNLLLSGSTLYGITVRGGASGNGNIYSVDTAGNGFNDIHDFNTSYGQPAGIFILSGSTLYGTTCAVNIAGSIFSMGTNGSGFTTLYSFNQTSGEYPRGILAISNGVLYSMAGNGGNNNDGVVFSYKL